MTPMMAPPMMIHRMLPTVTSVVEFPVAAQ
jgi:hypothetical protein